MRAVLLVAGVGLLALGAFWAFSSPTPNGYDSDIHGSDAICSSAIAEAFGFGSEDSETAAASAGDGPSIGIEDCKDPARRQTALAAVATAVGIGVLVARRRMPIPPARPIGG